VVAGSFPPMVKILKRGNVQGRMKPMYHVWEPIYSPTRGGHKASRTKPVATSVVTWLGGSYSIL